jgi:hypothetical protein
MTEKILAVYRGNVVDNRFSLISFASAYGKQMAIIYTSNYDQAATYTATYLMLDRSPVVPFIGSYAANEKTLLADLVDSVQQNTARVSVLENKKADKDNPAWLTPTLLNGWSSSSVKYLKMNDELVVIRGITTGGVVAPGTLLFTLPVGYRPGNLTEIRVRSSNGSGVESPNATIMIDSAGQVKTQNTTYMTVWLDGLSFLAEK